MKIAIITVIAILTGFLLLLHFYPENFSFSQSTRGILKLTIAGTNLVLLYFFDRVRKNNLK